MISVLEVATGLATGRLRVPPKRLALSRRRGGRLRPASTEIEPRLRSERHDVKQPTVSVIIPALNEADSIEWVLERIPPWVHEVILVDGLSTDRTEAVALAARPDIVIVHQHQRGKGAALRAGFAAATSDVVVMIDADGSTDPNEMHRFVDALEAGADFVKGSRHLDGAGSVDLTPVREAGNQAFVLLANLLYQSRFTDLCYGYCAFWRRHLDALALTADGFEIETQLVLNGVKAGLTIAEVPSVELERRAGSSNLHAFRDGKRVLKTMLRTRHQPLDAAGAADVRIDLLDVEVPAHDSAAWLPAGKDRRRVQRRRGCTAARGSEPSGERRSEDRRTSPARTVTIRRALPA